jgi:hypothetical protein
MKSFLMATAMLLLAGYATAQEKPEPKLVPMLPATNPDKVEPKALDVVGVQVVNGVCLIFDPADNGVFRVPATDHKGIESVRAHIAKKKATGEVTVYVEQQAACAGGVCAVQSQTTCVGGQCGQVTQPLGNIVTQPLRVIQQACPNGRCPNPR